MRENLESMTHIKTPWSLQLRLHGHCKVPGSLFWYVHVEK